MDGAVDWIVVRVVVSERTEGVGDEKVLPSPPPLLFELRAPLTVATVSAFEYAVSELMVSGFVDMVGAVDLLPMVGGGCPSFESGSENLLCDGETSLMLRPDGGVWKERWPLPVFEIEGFIVGFPRTGCGLGFVSPIFFELR